MKKIVIVLIGVICFFNASAQMTHTVTPVIDHQFNRITEMHTKPADAKGSIYLNDEWIASNIYLKKGALESEKIENVSIKVDLKTNVLEINTKDGIKILPGTKLDKFEWTNLLTNSTEVFVNCNTYNFNGTKLNGFCRVSGENIKLIKHHYLEVVKADYNVALDVGKKEDRILKKSKYYLAKDKELIECNKKSIYTVMADKEKQVKTYVKENHLRLNDENDLRSIVAYYNSI